MCGRNSEVMACILFPSCASQVPQLDILINNAGVVQGKLLLDLTAEDVQQYVDEIGA